MRIEEWNMQFTILKFREKCSLVIFLSDINYEFRVADNAIVFAFVHPRSCSANNTNPMFIINTVSLGRIPDRIDFN